MEPNPLLKIQNLRVDYGDFTAVHDLELTLPPGEIFGLVGPNGAGKTSTIRVLATLLDPTYGEVEVLGEDLFESPEKVHRVLGYMPDLAPAIPDLKVWEFLDLYAESYGLRGAEKRNRVDLCLEKVNLSDKRNVYGRGLSRGMTQRVVLAKTLLHAPRLLLLDEPASGMDPIARRDLRRILQELAADGAAIVISSHILSELSGMCSSIGIMHLGRLLRHGPMKDVLESIEIGLVEIEMEVVGDADSAATLIAARSDTILLRTDGSRLVVSFQGDARARSKLLRDLLERGIDVSSFTPSRSDIESLMMNLVEGSDA